MAAPLALPWPAWYTDYSDAARHRLYDLDDVQLVKARREQGHFFSAHFDRHWMFEHACFMAQFDVSDTINRFMASRFEAVVDNRQRAGRLAALTRSYNRRKAA